MGGDTPLPHPGDESGMSPVRLSHQRGEGGGSGAAAGGGRSGAYPWGPPPRARVHGSAAGHTTSAPAAGEKEFLGTSLFFLFLLLRGLPHYFRDGHLHLFRGPLERGLVEHPEHHRRLERLEHDILAFHVDGDSAGKRRGDLDVGVQGLLGVSGVAALVDVKFAVEDEPLSLQRRRYVVDRLHAEFFPGRRVLESLPNLANRLPAADRDEHVFPPPPPAPGRGKPSNGSFNLPRRRRTGRSGPPPRSGPTTSIYPASRFPPPRIRILPLGFMDPPGDRRDASVTFN